MKQYRIYTDPVVSFNTYAWSNSLTQARHIRKTLMSVTHRNWQIIEVIV